MRLPVGIDDFKKLIEGGYLFADKSLFIKDVMDDGAEVILITRPRRFGKTLNLSMLDYFLRQNHGGDENLFENLNISTDVEFCAKHQRQYPVIFVTFKDIKQDSYKESYADIVTLMSELYEKHSYLLEGNVLSESEKRIFRSVQDQEASLSNIRAALKKLSQYIKKKFKKSPIILIDEYDTPRQEAYVSNYYQKMIGLMRSILGQALKGNSAMSKCILTGITRISQESLFSGLNNISVYTLLKEKYGQYFGFKEEEVLKLIRESKKEISISSVTEWYNGYQVGKYVLYNPWSIIKCLDSNGQLDFYWINTSSNALIGKLLDEAKFTVKQQFEELLQGNTIEQPISENLVFGDLGIREDSLWSLLLYAGYLKVLSIELRGYDYLAKMAIPNKEVGFVYYQIVTGWFGAAISLDFYHRFVQSLANGQIDKFKEYLEAYIMQTGSHFDFNSNTPEQVYHVFILGLVVGLRDQYIIQSNKESGLGRFDVTFIPKDNKKSGILLEFKTSASVDLLLDKAREALDQIKDKQYLETFKLHNIASACAISVAFCGKQVALIYENIRIIA